MNTDNLKVSNTRGPTTIRNDNPNICTILQYLAPQRAEGKAYDHTLRATTRVYRN